MLRKYLVSLTWTTLAEVEVEADDQSFDADLLEELAITKANESDLNLQNKESSRWEATKIQLA